MGARRHLRGVGRRAAAVAAAALSVAAGTATAPANAKGPVLLTPAAASDVSGGRLLWSRCIGGSCNLYTRVGGISSRLPIASFGLPDDAAEATLGTGPAGQQVAAYARCGPSLRNCGLYMYDFATGVEQQLPVSSHGGAFMTPSISGDRVAYAYNPRGRDANARSYAIYWSYLNDTTMHKVRTEPMDTWRDQPTLALSGDKLAYAGDSRLTSCLDQSHIRIATLGTRRDTLVATGTNSTDVFSPEWDGGVLYYARDRFTKASYRHDLTRAQIAASRVERYSPGTSSTFATGYTPLAVSGVMPDGAQLFYQLVTKSAKTTGLYAAGVSPAFHRIKAHRGLKPR